MRLLKNSKGFTLAEMLIVMAVVVILAAAAMPVVAGQAENARETNDIDVLRAAYTDAYVVAYRDIQSGANTDAAGKGYKVNIEFTQQVDGWRGGDPRIGGTTVTSVGSATTTGKRVVTFTFLSSGEETSCGSIQIGDTWT